MDSLLMVVLGLLVGVVPVALGFWRGRRGIAPGTKVQLFFEVRAPTKSAVDLIARALEAEGEGFEIFEDEEEAEWGCGIAYRGIPYDLDRFGDMQETFHGLAEPYGGYCIGYRVECGSLAQIFIDEDEMGEADDLPNATHM